MAIDFERKSLIYDHALFMPILLLLGDGTIPRYDVVLHISCV